MFFSAAFQDPRELALILLTAAWMARKGQMRLRWLELRNMILFYIPCADMAALISNTDIHVELDNVFYDMEVTDSWE